MNNKSSRSNLAFRNSIVSGLVTLLNFPIQFINRYFMVHYLGATYLGLTSLFTNILSVLSLADLGIGTAIVFLMYKPLADHDYDKVSLIMHYYRKIYQAIALVIFTLGICILPFLRFFIGKSIYYPHVYWLFIIYLLYVSLSLLVYCCVSHCVCCIVACLARASFRQGSSPYPLAVSILH